MGGSPSSPSSLQTVTTSRGRGQCHPCSQLALPDLSLFSLFPFLLCFFQFPCISLQLPILLHPNLAAAGVFLSFFLSTKVSGDREHQLLLPLLRKVCGRPRKEEPRPYRSEHTRFVLIDIFRSEEQRWNPGLTSFCFVFLFPSSNPREWVTCITSSDRTDPKGLGCIA